MKKITTLAIAGLLSAGITTYGQATVVTMETFNKLDTLVKTTLKPEADDNKVQITKINTETIPALQTKVTSNSSNITANSQENQELNSILSGLVDEVSSLKKQVDTLNELSIKPIRSEMRSLKSGEWVIPSGTIGLNYDVAFSFSDDIQITNISGLKAESRFISSDELTKESKDFFTTGDYDYAMGPIDKNAAPFYVEFLFNIDKINGKLSGKFISYEMGQFEDVHDFEANLVPSKADLEYLKSSKWIIPEQTMTPKYYYDFIFSFGDKVQELKMSGWISKMKFSSVYGLTSGEQKSTHQYIMTPINKNDAPGYNEVVFNIDKVNGKLTGKIYTYEMGSLYQTIDFTANKQ